MKRQNELGRAFDGTSSEADSSNIKSSSLAKTELWDRTYKKIYSFNLKTFTFASTHSYQNKKNGQLSWNKSYFEN